MTSRLKFAALAFTLAVGYVGYTPAAHAEWVRCAEEHGYCSTPFPTVVRYGAHGTYTRRRVGGGGVACENGVFGDPLVGIVKHCDFWAR